MEGLVWGVFDGCVVVIDDFYCDLVGVVIEVF